MVNVKNISPEEKSIWGAKMTSILTLLTGESNTLATECGLGSVNSERCGLDTSFSSPCPVNPSGLIIPSFQRHLGTTSSIRPYPSLFFGGSSRYFYGGSYGN